MNWWSRSLFLVCCTVYSQWDFMISGLRFCWIPWIHDAQLGLEWDLHNMRSRNLTKSPACWLENCGPGGSRIHGESRVKHSQVGRWSCETTVVLDSRRILFDEPFSGLVWSLDHVGVLWSQNPEYGMPKFGVDHECWSCDSLRVLFDLPWFNHWICWTSGV